MLAIILAIVLIIAFIYYDPYVDITEDNVLLWYNGKGYRDTLFCGPEILIKYGRKDYVDK